MRYWMIVAAGAVALAGCAQDPKSIAPAYVSTVPYESWNCEQLGQESTRIDQALATASSQQKNARGQDVAGVILLGMPTATLSGSNIAPQIASLKGQKNAVETTMISKKCSAVPAAITPS